MSVLELVRPDLRGLRGYSSARLEAGEAGLLLNANEAPDSGVPGAGLHRYPQPQPAALVSALARTYGVRPEQVLVGRGSDEAVDLLTRALCRAGQDRVLICPPTFGMYQVCAAVQGAAVDSVPLQAEQGFALDFAALRAAVTPTTRIVWLCSPNNPTGGELPRAQVLEFVADMAGRALVVIDEAYGEFGDAPSYAGELERFPHLAVLRTLSKAYGLAGARIGSLLAHPELIALLRRLMAPYPLPTPCVDAALTALAAQPRVDAWVSQCVQERERVYTSLRLLPGVRQVWPSAANFVAFRVDEATTTWRGLAARGVVVRDVSHYLGLAGALRVSMGWPAHNDAFLDALRNVLTTPVRGVADPQTETGVA